MKKKWFGETLLEEAKTAHDAGPAPALVRHFQDINTQHVTWLSPFNEDRSRERVNPVAIDPEHELRRFQWKVEAGAEFAISLVR